MCKCVYIQYVYTVEYRVRDWDWRAEITIIPLTFYCIINPVSQSSVIFKNLSLALGDWLRSSVAEQCTRNAQGSIPDFLAEGLN